MYERLKETFSYYERLFIREVILEEYYKHKCKTFCVNVTEKAREKGINQSVSRNVFNMLYVAGIIKNTKKKTCTEISIIKLGKLRWLVDED